MTADTDTARALEVLRKKLDGDYPFGSKLEAALVALYAAAVEEDRLYLICNDAERDEDCGDEHFAQLWGQYRDAQKTKRECLANVAKAVLP